MVSDATAGVLAATAAPLAMSAGFVIWDKRWVGGSGFTLNVFKCCLASVGFFVVVLAIGGIELEGASTRNRSLLVLSGFIGIVLGDTCWLIALKRIGAHRTIVVDAIKPFVSALFSRAILGEKRGAVQILGMVGCLTGIVVVSLERANDADQEPKEKDAEEGGDSDDDSTNGAAVKDVAVNVVEVNKYHDKDREAKLEAPPSSQKSKSLLVGYAYSVINVLLDVYGAILTKQNGDLLDTWQVCWLRFGSSALILLILLFAGRRYYWIASSPSTQHQDWATFPQIGNTGYLWVALGVVMTTFLCPALQNYAIFKIDLGIFSTLVSLTPIFSLPLCYFIKGERVSLRAILGTIIAFAGVVILYVVD